MPVSKKSRFEVFKRDAFRCVYCGRTPPSVCLELDHIDPKVNGGSDDINNLVSACFDCNRGKGATPLGQAPASLAENLEVLKEKELQVREYNKFLSAIEKRLQRNAQRINEIYQSRFPKWTLAGHFINGSLRTFLKKLPLQEVEEAMHIACGRGLDNNRTTLYFCGICWRRINDNA